LTIQSRESSEGKTSVLRERQDVVEIPDISLVGLDISLLGHFPQQVRKVAYMYTCFEYEIIGSQFKGPSIYDFHAEGRLI